MTIDTPMNRKFMPDADFTSWTKSEDIAEKILEWSINGNSLFSLSFSNFL
jgi:hypothetical protein